MPFTPDHSDPSQEQTDAASLAVRTPVADGFRSCLRIGSPASATELLVHRAKLLTLTATEMVVLLGGLRVLGVNAGRTAHGDTPHSASAR